MATFNFGQPVGTNPLASPPNTRTTSIGSINKNPGLWPQATPVAETSQPDANNYDEYDDE